jgi:hypothetical protein
VDLKPLAEAPQRNLKNLLKSVLSRADTSSCGGVRSARLPGGLQPSGWPGGGRAYWEQLLEIAGQVTKLHSGVSAGVHTYVSTSAGTSGLSYNYWVTKDGGRVGLWIDRGRDNDGLDESIFQQLLAERIAIEQDFGGSLEWPPMDKARACKIVVDVPGAPGWRDDLDESLDGLREMADTMVRFERALAPRIATLDLALKVSER